MGRFTGGIFSDYLTLPWEQARGFIKEELEQLRAYLQSTFAEITTEDGTISGEAFLSPGASVPSYVANTGPDKTPKWEKVDLANGVKNRAKYANLPAPTFGSQSVIAHVESSQDYQEVYVNNSEPDLEIVGDQLVLQTTGVTPDTYGDATNIPQITVDSKGRVTEVVEVALPDSGISELTGDVTAGPGAGSQVATIAADAVTYAKMQNISAASKLLGRGSASGSGDTQEITLGTNLSMSGTTLNAAGSTLADADYGDITVSASGTVLTVDNDVVTNAKAANMADSTIKGRAVGAGTGDPTDLTANQTSTLLDTATDPFVRTSVTAPTAADYLVETAQAGLSAEVVTGTTYMTTAAYASRQAAAKSGRLFLPNDGFEIDRDSGSTWASWGPIVPLTPPVDGDFAWINQGGASVDTTNGGIYLLAPAGAGDSWRIRKKAAPSTPYVITAAFLLEGLSVDFHQVGLCFRQSSDGKLHVFTVQANSATLLPLLGSNKYTNTTTFSAAYSSQRYRPGWITFLRIADNGANRICSYSADGQHWQTFHSIGRTDFLTADEVGFAADSANATYPVGITLISWKQT